MKTKPHNGYTYTRTSVVEELQHQTRMATRTATLCAVACTLETLITATFLVLWR